MSRASSSQALAKPWRRPSESQVGFSYFVSKEASNYCDDVLSKKGQDLIERNVHIHDFKGFEMLEQFEQRGWVDAFLGYDDAYPEMVQEFLTNVIDIDLSLGSFTTYPHGMCMNFSVNSIHTMLNLPIVDNPQWPLAPSLMPSRCEVLRELTRGVYTVLNLPNQGDLASQYRILNKIMTSVISPSDNISDVNKERVLFLYGLGRGFSVDLAWVLWLEIYNYVKHPPGTVALPHISLLTRFMRSKLVPILKGEKPIKRKSPIDN
ncbi:hypothetical protein RHGRI_026084 [Rhododendron griersonianum]|uniref:Putative plant transposon protein domain-containing protein n=1 Tax=Rhododendron griersonianum TaxID=479676 RepID=A0AAV6IRC9_9ERIC|nr:hypothetical protein RHGRI_026084 [Rhododendron griersonianum]